MSLKYIRPIGNGITNTKKNTARTRFMMAGTMPNPIKEKAKARQNTPQQDDSDRTSNGDLYGMSTTSLSCSSSTPARNNQNLNVSTKIMTVKWI